MLFLDPARSHGASLGLATAPLSGVLSNTDALTQFPYETFLSPSSL